MNRLRFSLLQVLTVIVTLVLLNHPMIIVDYLSLFCHNIDRPYVVCLHVLHAPDSVEHLLVLILDVFVFLFDTCDFLSQDAVWSVGY